MQTAVSYKKMQGLNARLALVEATAVILKQGLAILGVESPDEM